MVADRKKTIKIIFLGRYEKLNMIVGFDYT